MSDTYKRFPTTNWRLIFDAAASEGRSTGALNDLCTAYWGPLYAYVRRRGHSRDDARDLVQGFFLRFLTKDYLSRLSSARGKFRSYLLRAIKNYMVNEHERASSSARGGGHQTISLTRQFDDVDRRMAREPADPSTPEDTYARHWALTVLDRALRRLRKDFAERGREREFEILEEYLPGSASDHPYSWAAQRLDVSEDAVRVSIHRFRQRYTRALRSEVEDTVSDATEVDAEIRFLLRSLSTDA